MNVIYNISIYTYYFFILVASLFNKKAKLWIKGRKNIFSQLNNFNTEKKKTAWFHAASLGEFEQGRPIIEAFKKENPNYKILITFFSPSGFEIRKNYELADCVCYLPLDTPANAKRFIKTVNPSIVFFIKYEFWFNYLNVLHTSNIPVFIISAIFRKEQHFFKWYGGWFVMQLKCFKHFFVQDENSKKLLATIGFENATVCSDTRFDRVFTASQQQKSFPLIEKFKNDSNLFVAGSTWEPDEKLIVSISKQDIPNLKFLIAPHEINKNHIQKLCQSIGPNVILFSEATENNIQNAKIIIIDSIGILLHLYQYATLTYIGGGFGKGIHNILEATAFGSPVIFGPNYQKFKEANDLIEKGGAISIKNFNKLFLITRKLTGDEQFRKNTSKICLDYINDNKGATETIIHFLKTILPS